MQVVKWWLLLLGLVFNQALAMTKQRKLELREQTREAFLHGYNGYMKHAFPFDELMPLSCIGRGRDRANPHNINVNDVLGDYLLTLVDTLDTLAVMGDKQEFARAVQNTIKFLPSFDIDSHVQVFEVTIRMLGGLLSAHIIATDEKDVLGMRLDNGTYNGELLELARDLGYRLLPAFEASPNGVPYPRTNLKHGFIRGETESTCAAGVGTLILEFGTLSRLTNETIFDKVARNALDEVWKSRSKKNLLGNEYLLRQQRWKTKFTGIGAGIDSLFEYLIKGFVYFGHQEYLDAFETAYEALLQYSRDTQGGYAFYNVDMHTAEVSTTWIDSLSAFFPGMMVLAGDVDGAESAYMLYYHLWRRFRAMPERFNLMLHFPDLEFYPLRPEFIESTYFLYRATKDPFYLDVGEMVLADINQLSRTSCGYTSLKSVIKHVVEERMESFFLSETLKYLYLLFDDENPLHKLDDNYVFTTEGHVLLPLSPVTTASNNSISRQYPSKSSFAKQRLMHSDHYPPNAVKPLFYSVDNIRRRLQNSTTFGLQSQNVSRNRLIRQCPVPRNANGLWQGKRSPLAQLYDMRQLSLAITTTNVSEQMLSQYVNSPVSTLAQRSDFFNIGALVGRHGKDAKNDSNNVNVAVEYVGRLNGSATISGSLAAGLEYNGMCIAPSIYAMVADGHWRWRKQNKLPKPTFDTWLIPNTRQVSLTELLFARSVNSNVVSWNIPHQPKVRQEIPLLQYGVNDEYHSPKLESQQKHIRRRGYAMMPRSKTSTDVVFSNGAGLVLTDHMVVRVVISAHIPSVKEDNVLLSRRHDYQGRLREFAEMSLYSSSHRRGHLPCLIVAPSTLIMLHLRSSSAVYGCEEYTPRERKLAKNKVVAVRAGGGCTAQEKAIHAMKAGARALLIDNEINTTDEQQQNICPWPNNSNLLDRHAVAEKGSERLTKRWWKKNHYNDGQQVVAIPVVELTGAMIDELEQNLVVGRSVQVELL